jgi:hypothetical protein
MRTIDRRAASWSEEPAEATIALSAGIWLVIAARVALANVGSRSPVPQEVVVARGYALRRSR